MLELLLALQALSLIGFVLVGVFLRNYLPSYVAEKAKNLATKEDIESITRKIEGVKAEFAAHDVRLTLFEQKRSEVTATIFELLHDPAEYIKHMVHPAQHGGEEGDKQRQRQAADAFNQLSGYYWKRKIYLPENLCKEVEAVLVLMKDAFTKYTIGSESSSRTRGLEMWAEAHRVIQDKMPNLLSQLESLFRDTVAVGQPLTDGAQPHSPHLTAGSTAGR